MTTRITGLYSGLDVDALVEAGSSYYKNKLDTAKQDKQVMQWKQDQYQSIESDVTDFYNKYLDITSADSLMSSSIWNTKKFTSSNDSAVTATGNSDASLDNYSVSVSQLASTAKTTLSSSESSSNAFSITMYSDTTKQNEKVTVDLSKYNNNKDKAAAINSALSAKGINLKATASDVSGTITLESGKTGSGTSFNIDGRADAVTGQNLHATITNSNGDVYKIDESSVTGTDYTSGSNTVTVDNVTFNFNATTTSSPSSAINLTSSNIGSLLGTDISKEASSSSTIYTFADGSKLSIAKDGTAKLTDSSGASASSLTLDSTNNAKITVSNGTIKYTSDSNTTGSYVTSSTISSMLGSYITKEGQSSSTIYTLTDGTNVTLSDDGTVSVDTSQSTSKNPDGTITYKSTDGSTTTLNTDGTVKTASNTPVTLKGTNDVSNLEDSIESFVNDYNTLITTINSKYYESYNSDYKPLTSDQEADMNSDQIDKWNTQAQTGLLHNDNYLDSLASGLKDAMSSFMNGYDLESFGITPVSDYTTKNGTYSVDSGKLTSALQDPDKYNQIKSLFLNGSDTITSTSTTCSNSSGLLVKLKTTMNKQVVNVDSIFSQQFGNDDHPVTSTTNEYYTELKDQDDLIQRYQDEYSDKEDALYLKYSNLETQLASLQSSSSIFSSSSQS